MDTMNRTANFYEYIGNTHVHTPYSDGEALHAEIAQAAGRAGIDFVIVTDHNIWVEGLEGYYGQVLLLVGEEIHDVRRKPQGNHLLVYGAEAELMLYASRPQSLIDEVSRRGGFCYLAHPYEYSGKDHEALPWFDWDVTGYAGIEVWNYMTEFKSLARNKLAGIYYAYFPTSGIRGPFRATLRQWDLLLSQGKRVSAIGGADAHGTTYSLGPLSRVLFPYDYLFCCVNTHVLTERPLNGSLEHDKKLIYDALRAGRTWVGYDLPAPTIGFQFLARCGSREATMGGVVERIGAVTFDVRTPRGADIRLLCNGRVVARASGRRLLYTSIEAGAYRVEAYRWYRLQSRGWIFSSPIYVG